MLPLLMVDHRFTAAPGLAAVEEASVLPRRRVRYAPVCAPALMQRNNVTAFS
jgi:hypothetical protein